MIQAARFYLEKRRLDRLRQPRPVPVDPADLQLQIECGPLGSGTEPQVWPEVAEQLTPKQIELLEARLGGCCSVKGLARRLGTSPSAIRKRMRGLQGALARIVSAVEERLTLALLRVMTSAVVPMIPLWPTVARRAGNRAEPDGLGSWIGTLA